MSKPVHPIRKLQQAIWNSNRVWDVDPVKEAQVIARHVKPLLDALEQEHEHVEHGPCSGGLCPTCRLLAAWRAKL